MLSEKSSLVPTVMLSKSKACLRGVMVVRTRVPLDGSMEGCCGFPIWQGRQTLSVPACSEVVCRVGEHQHRWHIDVHDDKNFHT